MHMFLPDSFPSLSSWVIATSNQLKPYNIKVCVSLPPDTDTPGFEEEQKSKVRNMIGMV